MDFDLTEDASLLRDNVRAFVQSGVADRGAKWDEDGEIPAYALESVAALWLFGLRAPEDAGGAAFGLGDAVLVLEELAAGSASLALVVAAHDVAMDMIVRADLCHIEQFSLCSGGALATFAAGGLVWNATRADWVVTGDAAHDAESLVREPSETLGLRAAGLGRVGMDAVALSPELAAIASLELAAIALGLGRTALAAAVDYAKERQQFGHPIAQFQAIQWKLADSATSLDGARLLVQRAAWLHDRNSRAGAFADAAHRARMVATSRAWQVCSEALQIHGGYGYTTEFPVERLLRDARTCSLLCEGEDADRLALSASIGQRFGG